MSGNPFNDREKKLSGQALTAAKETKSAIKPERRKPVIPPKKMEQPKTTINDKKPIEKEIKSAGRPATSEEETRACTVVLTSRQLSGLSAYMFKHPDQKNRSALIGQLLDAFLEESGAYSDADKIADLLKTP